MRDPAKLKKSESLEIRLPFPTKEAFMARCRQDGRSASDALRGFIDGYLEPTPVEASRSPNRPWRLVIAGAVAAGLAATVAPALARPTPAIVHTEAEFQRLDRDHDGKLTLVEFKRLARDKR